MNPNPIDVLREKCAKLHADAKAIEAAADSAGRELNAEEVQKLSDIDAAFEDAQKQIAIRERAEAREASLSQPQARVVTAAPVQGETTVTRAPITGGTTVSASYANHGFTRGFPEYLNAVKLASFGKSDSRLLNAVTTYGGEGVGPDGGFGVPPQFSSQITSIVTGEQSLVAKFNPIVCSGNQVVLPTDETTPYGTSGIYAEWSGEAAALSARKPALKQVTVTLQKVGALVHLSDELAADAPAIQSHVTRKVGAAIAAKVNEAIISGDGISKPLGLLNAPGLVTVSDTGTGSGVFTAEDLGSMLSRIVPESVANAFWLCHSTVLPKLWALTLGYQPVYSPDWRVSPYGALLGRPVYVSEFCSDYNTAGDIILVSPDGYALAVKSMGIETAASIHFAFDQGLNSFRATMRVGGAPLASGTISRKNGTSVLGHIVVMAARSS